MVASLCTPKYSPIVAVKNTAPIKRMQIAITKSLSKIIKPTYVLYFIDLFKIIIYKVIVTIHKDLILQIQKIQL